MTEKVSSGRGGLAVKLKSMKTRLRAPVPSRRRTRVLVVDDNQAAADSLQLILSLNDYEVRVAYTGPDGVRLALEWPPDVVLCDIGLPGLDGYGVATTLRQHALTAGARLVAVTAYDSDSARERSLRAGFERHLVKPVDPRVLLDLLSTP
jgi:CheY-like chemotaxis protein